MTIYSENPESVIQILVENLNTLFQKFPDNQVKADRDKCNILVWFKNGVLSTLGLKLKKTLNGKVVRK